MKTEKYIEQIKRLPTEGKQIIASKNGDAIIVYQAYNASIASYAVKHQKFGGAHYSMNRMSWIKPGFLWMMYRSGWASKENQECILAITIPLEHFKTILKEATISSFKRDLFESKEKWQTELANTDVRLQWDPDHDPYGNKLNRKAIQIGMKGAMLQKFCNEWITKIEDITPFVKEQYQKLMAKNMAELDVPLEEVIDLNDVVIEKRIGTYR